jgi:hypothetical protein
MPALRRLLVLTVLAVLTVTLAGFATPAVAAPRDDHRTTVTITHAPLAPTAVIGTGLGAVRTFYVPIRVNGKASPVSFLTATLTTTAVGLADNTELRASDLVFVVGREANQLVVGGTSRYPSDGGTLAAGQRTVRPVVGGSGIYDGARGSVVSVNLGERGWRHVFTIQVS